MNTNAEPECELLDILFETVDLGGANCALVKLDSAMARNIQLLQHEFSALSDSTKYVLVIIDESKNSALMKLFDKLRRRQIFRNCLQSMRREGFEKLGLYAIYPSIERLTVVYPIDTAAANYAEAFLLSETLNLPKRILNIIFKALGLGSPVIDVIVMIGCRK